MVLWTPLLRTDNRPAAERAALSISDPRAEHFWDLWSYANKSYAEQFNLPIEEAWDLFVIYQPKLEWNGSLPKPSAWMQHRHLKTGTPYSKDLLEKELLKWIK